MTRRTKHRIATIGTASLAAAIVFASCGLNTDGPNRSGAQESQRTARQAAQDFDRDSEDIASTDADEADLEQADNSQGLADSSATQPVPDAEPQHDGAVELPPVDQPAPTPCDAHPSAGPQLLVTPDPSTLASGVMKSSLNITNCGDADINWTAATKPWVSLGSAGAALSPGASTELGFTIDDDVVGPGAVDFKIKVSEPNHNHYVDIHAYDPLLGSDIVHPGGGLSGGPAVTGCANQCITKAWLTPNLQSPNTKLEMKTNTPATMRVYISKNAPQMNGEIPNFPGVFAMATSPANSTTWTTTLKPLQSATKYYIIVKATDSNAKSSYRSSHFTTITPLENPGGVANPAGPAGCAVQCITSAIVSPGDHTTRKLNVASNTDAQFQVAVSTDTPSWSGTTPSFGATAFWGNSGLAFAKQWNNATISELSPATKYHIIVKATDKDGHKAYRVGEFRTPAAPTTDVALKIENLHVINDGDKHSKGELSFAWMVGDTTIATKGEKRVDDGADIKFVGFAASFIATDITTFLPTVSVSAFERDADGWAEFCTMGTGGAQTKGSDDGCDMKWNAAGSGLVSVAGISALPTCVSLGLGAEFGDTKCMKFQSQYEGNDYPHINAIVSVRIV